MAAPVVQNLQDIIAQIQAAYKPQQDFLDTQVASNEASGTVQNQAIEAQKGQAFGQIEQGAQNKGMYFSGFSPDQQAKYTAATYLPALAKVQEAIASARGQLLGKKAEITSQGNTQGLQVQQSQQSAYNEWQREQERMAFEAAQAEKNRQAQAAAARASAARSGGGAAAKPTTSQFLVQAFSGYDPKAKSFFTEREIIPALQANYGLSAADAKKMAYTYRKNVFGE